jgi:hypothetical protein
MDQIASRNCASVVFQSSTLRSPPVHQPDSGACPVIQRSNRHCAIIILTQSVFRELPHLVMLNPIEPPWYVTRMPGGVTGKTREGLPMSIYNPLSISQGILKNRRAGKIYLNDAQKRLLDG